jgi:hypothetical protein
MTVVLIILGIIVLAVAGLLAVAASRPDRFRVVRSIAIAAPAERIVPLIDDFRRWSEWSPWEGKDPAMKRSFEGPAAGVGAVYGWDGNKQVGRGRMEVVESKPDAVKIKLDFVTPFEAHNMAEFQVSPGPGGSTLTWSMQGPSPLMMRVMGLFMNMDTMIGRDFEAGLAKLKAAAER